MNDAQTEGRVNWLRQAWRDVRPQDAGEWALVALVFAALLVWIAVWVKEGPLW